MYYVFIPFYSLKMFTNIIGGYKFYMQVKYFIGSTYYLQPKIHMKKICTS